MTKLIRVMVTGHRSYPDLTTRNYIRSWIERQLTTYADLAENKNYRLEVVSGMALGVDTVFAELAGLHGIDLVAAVPFKQQTGWKKVRRTRNMGGDYWVRVHNKAWPVSQRITYERLLDEAKLVVEVDKQPGYAMKNVEPGKFHGAKFNIRNQWMVDYAKEADVGVCLALWSGRPSGTANCVRAARKASLKIKKYWPKTLEDGAIYLRGDNLDSDIPF